MVEESHLLSSLDRWVEESHMVSLSKYQFLRRQFASNLKQTLCLTCVLLGWCSRGARQSWSRSSRRPFRGRHCCRRRTCWLPPEAAPPSTASASPLRCSSSWRRRRHNSMPPARLSRSCVTGEQLIWRAAAITSHMWQPNPIPKEAIGFLVLCVGAPHTHAAPVCMISSPLLRSASLGKNSMSAWFLQQDFFTDLQLICSLSCFPLVA